MGPYGIFAVARALAVTLNKVGENDMFGIEADGVPGIVGADVISDEPQTIGLELSNGERYFVTVQEV